MKQKGKGVEPVTLSVKMSFLRYEDLKQEDENG